MSEPASTPDKDRIVAALLEQVQAELDGMEAVAEAARDEATSSETKAEGKYDTRATEASYLARGQAWRIVSLRKQVAWLGRALFNPLPSPSFRSAHWYASRGHAMICSSWHRLAAAG